LTLEVQLDHFLYHTPELGIPAETVQFPMKRLLKQRFLVVHHVFHWSLIATKLLAVKLHSRYTKEPGLRVGNFEKVRVGVGVGYFTSDSATLLGGPLQAF